MQTTKKRPSIVLICTGALLAAYLGYLVGGAWHDGMDLMEFMESFNRVCSAPFGNYFSHDTPKIILFMLFFYALAVLMYCTGRKNFMPGREYGTARFEKPGKVDKALADRDGRRNRILSRNVRMSMDFRRLKLNGNILICGGSGAGKTFYEVKPNLMQMPAGCSFICTDPKGGARRSHLKRVGTAQI